MSMTKKDFELVAKTIQQAFYHPSGPQNQNGISQLGYTLADAFAAEYPNFNYTKFVNKSFGAPPEKTVKPLDADSGVDGSW